MPISVAGCARSPGRRCPSSPSLPVSGRVVTGGLGELVELVANPDVLNAMLIFLVVDLVYRLLAVLDAYRLATDSSVGSGATRLASTAGLVALVVVLVGSHVVVARPIFFATDLYADMSENAGDESEVISAEELAARDEDFRLITEEQFEEASAAPDEPGASRRTRADRHGGARPRRSRPPRRTTTWMRPTGTARSASTSCSSDRMAVARDAATAAC